MSDHSELADEREQEAEEMQEQSERLEGQAEQARDDLEATSKDSLIPAALGDDDPGARPEEKDEDD